MCWGFGADERRTVVAQGEEDGESGCRTRSWTRLVARSSFGALDPADRVLGPVVEEVKLRQQLHLRLDCPEQVDECLYADDRRLDVAQRIDSHTVQELHKIDLGVAAHAARVWTSAWARRTNRPSLISTESGRTDTAHSRIH